MVCQLPSSERPDAGADASSLSSAKSSSADCGALWVICQMIRNATMAPTTAPTATNVQVIHRFHRVFMGRCSVGRTDIRLGRLGKRRATAASTGDEVLRLRVVADDRGGGLLRLVLPTRFFADLDAEAVGTEQVDHRGVVLEIR